MLKKLTDYTVQLGGPIKRDKAFWWASVQRYAFELDPVGPRTISTEISPRYNGKLTCNITPNDTLIGSFQYDNYNVTGRTGLSRRHLLDRPADRSAGLAGSGLERPVPQGVQLEHVPRGEVHGILGLLLPRPGRQDADPHRRRHGRVPRRRGLLLLRRPRPQPGERVAVEVRGGVRDAQLQVRHRVRAQQVALPVGVPVRADRSAPATSSTTAACRTYAYSGAQLQHQGQEQARVLLRAGRVEEGPAHGQPRAPARRRSAATARTGRRTCTARSWPVGPRLGAVFDLRGNGNSVVRAFWGRYYEGASLSPFAMAIGGNEDYVVWEVVGNKFAEIRPLAARSSTTWRRA